MCVFFVTDCVDCTSETELRAWEKTLPSGIISSIPTMQSTGKGKVKVHRSNIIIY